MILADSAGRGLAKPGWNPTAARRGTPRPRQLERHHAAETEPDRGDAICVHARLRDEHVVSGQRQSAGRGRVLEQLAETSLGGGQRVCAAAAEIVEGEHDVPELGEPIGTSPNIVVLPSALVHQQHTRS